MQTAEILKFRPKEVVRVADIENGYTRIANQLLEAIYSQNLTERQFKIVLFVMRKTYGFNKKSDFITNTQIADAVNVHHTHICKSKLELIERKILILDGKKLGINKNSSEWIERKKSNISQISQSLAKSANKTLARSANRYYPNQLNTKDTITKYNKNNTPISPKGEKQATGNNPIVNSDIEVSAMSLLDHYNKIRNAHCRDYSPFLKALGKYSFDEIKQVIDWFMETGKGNAKPANICRMTRFDGYVSDSIKSKNSIGMYSDVISTFNEICGDKIGIVEGLTAGRMSKISWLMGEFSKTNPNPIESLRAYLQTLMSISTEQDFKNPVTNWEMNFEYVLSETCLVRTREKYNKNNRWGE